MSPVNSDDASGVPSSGTDRPLTRKEIRAREKLLATQTHLIPPQAFETGEDTRPAETPEAAVRPAETPEAVRPAETPEAVRPEAPAPPAPLPPADAPELPVPAPTVHAEPVHDEPAPEAQVPDEPVPDHPLYEEPVPEEQVHEYAGGVAFHAGEPYMPAPQHGFEAQHEADDHEGYAAHPEDGAHQFYDGGDVHHEDPAGYDGSGPELMTGAASIRTAKGPSKKVRRRRRFLALVLSLTVFVVAIAVGAQFLKPLLGGDTVADYPGPGTGQVTITVPEGAGPKSVATELQDKKVIANAESFLKEFAASGGALSPGDFSMRQEMKNSDAVAVLLNKDKSKVMYFALSAGKRISESLQAISEGTGIPVADLKALSDAPAQFGVPAKAKNLEGFLSPGEFRFPLGTTAKDILQKLVTATLDELKAQGVTDPAKQYDVVTVASIVQAEGGQAEYGDVAGAIYNRLKPNNTETNGLIQSDATVTYGLGIRSFHIDEVQKADKSNPYNTYANPGLPAGPIGSPGKTAIDAAANPKANDYLYWVTINLDTKETKFAKTLAEHNVNVAKYNAWCDANPNRCV
ncbi:endolytic transglycosylase MltG [Arthrobacter sp. PAMC25564]|uniref:endolytic transglycosylase MltG n=1 Tax=Arthrobacter sp. PAMC25564 TaxID=2565366 RepID=UPI0010A28150|nr:endolytic transglycosylase MltG [Arthrobacter sp. PAMC25564]QCB97518.1 endolytic transglycosylase MltG [Arthrobacter sp. PAMC25564]